MRLPPKRHSNELFIAALVTAVAVPTGAADADKRFGVPGPSFKSGGSSAFDVDRPSIRRVDEVEAEASGARLPLRPKLGEASADPSGDGSARQVPDGMVRDIFNERAEQILEAERRMYGSDSVHPLALKYPGYDVIVCEAGCDPGGKVVYKVSKSAQKREIEVAEMMPTAGAQPPAVSSNAVTCVAGCYSTPSKYRAVEKPTTLVPSGGAPAPTARAPAPGPAPAAVAAPAPAAAPASEESSRAPRVGATADAFSGKWAAPAAQQPGEAGEGRSASESWAPKVTVESDPVVSPVAKPVGGAAAPAKIAPVETAAEPKIEAPAQAAKAPATASADPKAADAKSRGSEDVAKAAPAAETRQAGTVATEQGATGSEAMMVPSAATDDAPSKQVDQPAKPVSETKVPPAASSAPAKAPVAAVEAVEKSASPVAPADSTAKAHVPASEPAKVPSTEVPAPADASKAAIDKKAAAPALDAPKVATNAPAEGVKSVEGFGLTATFAMKSPAAALEEKSQSEKSSSDGAPTAGDMAGKGRAPDAAKAESSPAPASGKPAPPAIEAAKATDPAKAANLALPSDSAKAPEAGKDLESAKASEPAKEPGSPAPEEKPRVAAIAPKASETGQKPAEVALKAPEAAPDAPSANGQTKVAARPEAKPKGASRVIDVAGDDAEMNAAIAKARASLAEFWTSMEKPNPGESAFALKVAVSDKGDTEHFWVNRVERRGNTIVGTINNKPTRVKTVRMGQVFEFTEDRITDWMFMRNGKMVGNETMRPLLSRMPAEEAATYRSMLEKP